MTYRTARCVVCDAKYPRGTDGRCRRCSLPWCSGCGLVRTPSACGRCMACVVAARVPKPVEPTAAEVEAIVAEQMKRLPPWWELESRREAELNRPPALTIPTGVHLRPKLGRTG